MLQQYLASQLETERSVFWMGKDGGPWIDRKDSDASISILEQARRIVTDLMGAPGYRAWQGRQGMLCVRRQKRPGKGFEMISGHIDPAKVFDLPILERLRLGEDAVDIHADSARRCSFRWGSLGSISGNGGLHGSYGSALAAHSGKPQGASR